MIKIKHVVFDRYENLRWYFIDTLDKKQYFISLRISDFKYLAYGIFILIPPFSKKHISGNWN